MIDLDNLPESLVKEYRYTRDKALRESGPKHEYYLGKQVGMIEALACIAKVDWCLSQIALDYASVRF